MHQTSVQDTQLERLLNAPDLASDDALIALAERFAGCNRAFVLDRLDEHARALFGAASRPPREQADLLAELLTCELQLRPVTHDHRALLIDRALLMREAHPLVIAAIGHELARRAGLDTRICRARTDWWIAVPGDEILTAIGCCAATATPSGPLRQLCPHQLAFALLAHMAHYGPAGWHADAMRLMRRLPDGHHEDARS
jgi:hypothetical protein